MWKMALHSYLINFHFLMNKELYVCVSWNEVRWILLIKGRKYNPQLQRCISDVCYRYISHCVLFVAKSRPIIQEKIPYPLVLLCGWINQTTYSRLTGENQHFNNCAWGIYRSVNIPKTVRHHWVQYKTFLDKAKEGGWGVGLQKFQWVIYRYLRRSETHDREKFLLGNLETRGQNGWGA